MTRSVSRGRFLTAQKKPGEMGDDKKIHKKFLSAIIVVSSKNLVTSSFDAVEPLVGRPPYGR